MKTAITLIALGAATLFASNPAGASGHTLVVDGVSYDSTQESGSTIQWETAGGTPQHAEFAERGQVWNYGDNGTIKLPCEFGIHWVSNENVLTISHCLEGSTTSTSSTTDPTTTTSTSTTTTTEPVTTSSTTTSSSTTLPVTTTTVSESTSTSSTPTTSQPESSTSSSTLPTTTASPSTMNVTTTPSTSGVTTVPAQTTATTTTLSPNLPTTGTRSTSTAMIAAALLFVGSGVILLARRRP